MTETFGPEDILDLWFPDNGFTETREAYGKWIFERMQGGMDDVICTKFGELTEQAARGELDHWAETARGRLALILVLDQFPRSLWRDTPAAFAQDIKACKLATEGLDSDHWQTYAPWEKAFFLVAISHCEGPDHLERFDVLEGVTDEIVAALPPQLEEVGPLLKGQTARVRGIIERFGRHPHRNPVLGRICTPEEEAYIAEGDFPHVRKEPPV